MSAAELSLARSNERLRERLHADLIADLDLRRTDVAAMASSQLRQIAESVLDRQLQRLTELTAADKANLRRDVLDHALGLGPLENLLRDADVSEIMVNNRREIYVERGGVLQAAEVTFADDAALRRVVDRIVAPTGRRVDDASPMVDTRMPDGSRVNVVLPPLATRGPAITLRRFSREGLAPQRLLQLGSLSLPMLAFLQDCVRARRNILVFGGTGSGKTTLLRVLAGFIPTHERIVTIEDSAELELGHPNMVALEARPPNIEGAGAVTIRDLVRNALRMRPDRIVIGECRGGEALDMLQAMNTGHEGSLTTAHANSPRELLSRLEVMVLMAGLGLPAQAIREQIAAALHIIVQQARFADGRRRIVRVSEVAGIESGTIQLQDIFCYRSGLGFAGCGQLPAVWPALQALGTALTLADFDEPSSVGVSHG